MSEQKHSPTPWYICQGSIVAANEEILFDSVCGPRCGMDGRDWQRLVDARFACLAVDNHERLVEALRNLTLSGSAANVKAASALLAEIEATPE